MSNIIYYVASSLDGFIAGKNDNVSQFIVQGKGVEQYQADLATYATTLMGRRTYEIGYQYGLLPGQPAYPHMTHHIFSNTLRFEQAAESVHVEPLSIERVKEIKAAATTDLYLCVGGTFAGWLLDHGLVDQLKIKLNPIVLGTGTPLFGASQTVVAWKLVEAVPFEDGLQILTYEK